MTRKDFEAIANIIRIYADAENTYDRNTVAHLAESLAGYLSTTNPRFDASRFMRAAGL